MDSLEIARVVRRACGLFARPDRGLIELRGVDRIRWLNGMVTSDVRGLDEPKNHHCCYALSLSSRGMILGDFFAIGLHDVLWLDVDRVQLASTLEHLQKFIIADDVSLADISASWTHVCLEGPKAMVLLREFAGRPVELTAGLVCQLELGGASVLLAGYNWSGEPAAQLFVPVGEAAMILNRLRTVGERVGLVEGDAGSLEILRVEAGIADLRAELLPDVFPFEAGLTHAVSTTKGCYLGQEIMARLASRGHVNHLLVGLAFEGTETSLPCAGTAIVSQAEQAGELTSAVLSPHFGPIGLGYVRAALAEPGTLLKVAERDARVRALPFFEAKA